MNNTFTMMVGLPGSGKSTIAEICKNTISNTVIHSSDALRKELFGDVNNQENNVELFKELHKRIIADLESGYNVVYDSTNISSKRRMNFLNQIKKIDCTKNALVFDIDFETCLRRNWSRERIVPFEVMDRMYKHWETPAKFEGWNNVCVVGNIFESGTVHKRTAASKFMKYDQNNPHHKETLGEHLIEVGQALEKYNDEDLAWAGYYHDCGKPYCRTEDANGISHYYNHANVGAYDAVAVYGCSLETAALINYHMYPMSWTEEKTKEKYKKLWGDWFFNRIMLLHEADKGGIKNDGDD